MWNLKKYFVRAVLFFKILKIYMLQANAQKSTIENRCSVVLSADKKIRREARLVATAILSRACNVVQGARFIKKMPALSCQREILLSRENFVGKVGREIEL